MTVAKSTVLVVPSIASIAPSRTTSIAPLAGLARSIVTESDELTSLTLRTFIALAMTVFRFFFTPARTRWSPASSADAGLSG